jgi:ABC-type branched-subunit amino acid transport system substrate-binding protein
LANYLRKINGAETATIINTNDGYGQSLAKQFRNTFRGLGGQITIETTVRSLNERDLEEVVSNIISAGSEIGDPRTIFIAADEETAAQLVILMKRNGISYPVVGQYLNYTGISRFDPLDVHGNIKQDTERSGHHPQGSISNNGF